MYSRGIEVLRENEYSEFGFQSLSRQGTQSRVEWFLG